MNEQKILHIREAIAQAQQAERETRALSSYLWAEVPRLHPIIDLPRNDPHRALMDFVTSYVEQVPDCLEAFSCLMGEAGISELAQRFVDIAEDFFGTPPELVADHEGMRALIDEAYLVYRLIEEVNDLVLVRCGIPLTPIDTTYSNLLVHHLLGDEFANQLDKAVRNAVEAFFPLDQLLQGDDFTTYIRVRRTHGWADALERWPCLAGEPGVLFRLGDRGRRQRELH